MAPQPSKIWADYPVKDINRSKEFYTALGFTVRDQTHDGDHFLALLSAKVDLFLICSPLNGLKEA